MKKALSMLLVIVMLMGMLVSVPMVGLAADKMPDGLFLWYTFDDGSGKTVTDSSGNGYNGTLNGGATWTSGVMGGAAKFDGVNGYVSLPNSIFKDLSNYTVATWYRADELKEWQRIFDFGSSTSSYAFLTPMGNGTPRYGIKQGSASEQTLIVSNMTFPVNEWKHVALTTEGTTVRLYVDGVLVGTRTNTTLTLSSLGETTRNYIGRSQFSGDAYLNGRIDDFRVYSRALSADEIKTVMTAGMTDQGIAEAAVNAVVLGDTERVVENINLPKTGIFNTTLSWESSDPSVVKNDGTVIRPAKGQGNKTVTLTVTARKGEASASRQISVTVMEEGTIDYIMNVDAAKQGINISQTLYGMFYEDINYAADGGLYAELVQNRSFEYYSINKYSGASLRPLTAWSSIGSATLSVKDEQPLNSNNTKYLEMVITASDTVAGVANSGFDGIAIEEGAGYDFSFWARRDGNFDEPFTISLQNSNGTVIYGQTQVTVTSDQWTKYTAELTSNATVSNARLAITTKGAGKVWMDMVSLFPKETYKNRPNGMRKDLAELIESYQPKIFRFPGGCVVHGDSLENAYDWKKSIGPVEERVPNFNRWGYHQSLGLGFFEYFQFCEDIGAEPFPILSAGVDCRFEGGAYEVASMEEMQKYIDDALDLIEYANGPADSEWGSKRAAAGHPEPFNLKYIGIGNEDWGNDFFTRFQMINDAIKAKYPDIQVVFSSGPYASGTEFTAGWNYAKQNNLDVVDEHYYQNDTFFLSNIRRYDSYDRKGPKVFVGEYACHGNGNDLYSALVESAYLTGIERNADIVLMASYAPLFARVGRTQWTNADLIWFDSSRVYATPNYYAQKMFANNLGDVILPTTVKHYTGTTLNHWSGPIYYVANRDYETGDVIIKVVNLSGRPQTIDINIEGVDYVAPKGVATVLANDDVRAKNTLDQPENVASKTEVIEGTGKNFSYTFKKNSVTVLRLATNDGSEAEIVEIVPTNVMTEAGVKPELPTAVTAKYSNGTQRKQNVIWDSIDPSKYAKAGTFTVEGTVGGTSIKAVANVTVIEITSFQPVNVTTEVGKAPALPTTVMAQYSNGSQKAKEVSWETIDSSKYAKAGTFTVEGTVKGAAVKAVANITVIEITAVQPVNVKTDVGAAPKLPSTVTVVYNNGSQGTKAVVWDTIDPSLYAKDGTFKVEGTVEGTSIKAVANVTVGKAPGLEEGLVLWYKFDDESGNTVTDSSGSGYNGKLNGTPNWVEGVGGSALKFNGTDNYIEVGTGTALQPSKITVAYWIKRTASMNSGEKVVFWAKPDTGWSQNGWYLTYNGQSSIMIVDGFNGFCVNQAPDEFLPLNEWTHVVVTFDSETKEAEIYKNGVPQKVSRGEQANLGGDPSSITATDPSDVKYMGFNGPTWSSAWQNATFDDFRIYNRVLSESQVKTLFERAKIESIKPVEVTTKAGQKPQLPSTVTAVYSDGTEEDVDVVWDTIDPSLYAKEGTFTVEGTVEGTSIKAVANVTVGKALDLEEGLVLWYKFNDASGTTVTDSSGSGYNGKLNGTPNWVEGVGGSALKFNGTDNYIEVGTGTALQPSKLTVGYWIKRTASMNSGEKMVFWAKPDTGWSQNGWYLTYNGQSSIMIVDGFNGFCVNQAPDEFLPLNEWTHVVVTFDSETKEAAIYKNGVPQKVSRGEAANLGGDPSSITATDPSDVKYMGFNGPTWSSAWQNATFDDFRIYNKALTEEEVKALYEEEKGPQIEPTIESIKPVEVTTRAGEKPQLPSTVTAVYSDGTEVDVAVVWDAIDPSLYAKEGTFTVEGTVAGTDIKAIATVKVEAAEEDKYEITVTFNMDALKPNSLLEARVTVKNINGSHDKVMAIVALYDENDRMVNVSFISKGIAIGEKESLKAGFKLPFNITNYKAKIFVWDGESLDSTNMIPLSNVVTLQ